MPQVVLKPASSGIIKQPDISLPSQAPSCPDSSPRGSSTMPANDPMRRILSMGAEQAFSAARERLTTVADAKIEGSGEAAVKSAAAAAAALTETSMLIQQGHRKLDRLMNVSTELSANLIVGATQLASAAPAIISGAASGKSEQVAARLATVIASVATVTDVALEAARQATRSNTGSSPAGYL